MANQPGLSEAEREVLRVLWDHGPRTVREINEVLKHRGRRWAYTTVATLLQRLAVKQHVASDPSTVPHIYRAVVSREEMLERRSHVLDPLVQFDEEVRFLAVDLAIGVQLSPQHPQFGAIDPPIRQDHLLDFM